MPDGSINPFVTTDKSDYAPGETATITASGFEAGATVEFDMSIVEPGGDGVIGTSDDILVAPSNPPEEQATWQVTDGVRLLIDAGADGIEGTGDDVFGGDLDGVADGKITTTWLVDPGGYYLDVTLELSAADDTDGDGVFGGAGDNVATTRFTDSGGAYSINFAAADPGEYIPPIPFPDNVTPIVGRGNGDTQIPTAWFESPNTNADVKVESLAPEDMALGQVVPFEIKITVDGETAPEDGVITFDAGWRIDTTNGGDFGYDESLGVIAAFVDTGDGAHVDPGNDATVQSFSWSVVGDEIVGTFTVSGLDDGDVVVVEPWLVLEDFIPEGSTGNVQSRLISAETVAETPDSINTGNQTVPLLKVKDFFDSSVDVAVTKSDDPDPVTQGEQLTYTITVVNNGPSIANGVVVEDQLDSNVTFVSASDGGVYSDGGTPSDPSDDTVTWDLGALVPGNPIELTLVVDVEEDAPVGTDSLSNTVTVTTISDDTNPDNDSDTEPTTVEKAEPDVAIDIEKWTNGEDADSPTGPTIAVGGAVNWQYFVTNNGPDDIDTNDPLVSVVVTDDQGAVLSFDASSDADGDGILSNGETWRYTASDVATAGQYANVGSVEVRYDDEVISSDTDPSHYFGATPALSIDKTISSVTDTNGNGLVDAGDVINYAINVANTGNVTLTGVTVKDPVAGIDVAVGELAVGADTDVTGSYAITQADMDDNGGGDGDIDNTARANSDQTDPVEDSAEQPIDRDPALEFDKSGEFADEDGDGFADVGETITYAFTVRNTGNVTLTGVTVTDPLVAITGGPITLAAGETDTTTFTGSHVITQADIDAGHFYNTATADSEETGPEEDDHDEPLPQDPSIHLDKVTVGSDGQGGGDGLILISGTELTWRYTVTNDGNVTLDTIDLTDDKIGDITNRVDDGDGDGVLSPGESWVYEVDGVAREGAYHNVGTVTAEGPQDQPVEDSDPSSYTGMDGPGVRTPGFWSQKNWQKFWDGTQGNEPGQAGQDTFADGDLFHSPYTNSAEPGKVLDPDDGTYKYGILIGDYNRNGMTDGDEVGNTIFYATDDPTTKANEDEALKILGANSKQIRDDAGVQLARHEIASWLNYLAGNAVTSTQDSAGATDPKAFIDLGIDWLNGNYTEGNVLLKKSENIGARDAEWSAPYKPAGFPDNGGEWIKDGLASYNQTGGVDNGVDGFFQYAADADSGDLDLLV